MHSLPRILITAGPTQEPLDPVRFISNRSSGKLGIALARAGMEAGCPVTLLLAAGVHAPLPGTGIDVRRFQTAADLQSLLVELWPEYDVLVMAAAVADYRPRHVRQGKLPRESSGILRLELDPTPDLVDQAAQHRRADQRIIAFALEDPDKLVARAQEKLRRKGVDAIVANPLKTMDADTIHATWMTAAGECLELPPMIKTHFSSWLIARVLHMG
jgi:phosphopantothenoylcysteine decarboxylase/phosphopantothenate--cysteine ligase